MPSGNKKPNFFDRKPLCCNLWTALPLRILRLSDTKSLHELSRPNARSVNSYESSERNETFL